eukprot:2991645-Amphidinium_carterae.1
MEVRLLGVLAGAKAFSFWNLRQSQRMPMHFTENMTLAKRPIAIVLIEAKSNTRTNQGYNAKVNLHE